MFCLYQDSQVLASLRYDCKSLFFISKNPQKFFSYLKFNTIFLLTYSRFSEIRVTVLDASHLFLRDDIVYFQYKVLIAGFSKVITNFINFHWITVSMVITKSLILITNDSLSTQHQDWQIIKFYVKYTIYMTNSGPLNFLPLIGHSHLSLASSCVLAVTNFSTSVRYVKAYNAIIFVIHLSYGVYIFLNWIVYFSFYKMDDKYNCIISLNISHWSREVCHSQYTRAG
jgi:hypothetical protein